MVGKGRTTSVWYEGDCLENSGQADGKKKRQIVICGNHAKIMNDGPDGALTWVMQQKQEPRHDSVYGFEPLRSELGSCRLRGRWRPGGGLSHGSVVVLWNGAALVRKFEAE